MALHFKRRCKKKFCKEINPLCTYIPKINFINYFTFKRKVEKACKENRL
jgi:hypothetical protein